MIVSVNGAKVFDPEKVTIKLSETGAQWVPVTW
jgi:hypothetical protein